MKKILAKLLNGEISIEDAEGEILNEFFSVSTFASLDINREMRSGIPEVVYAEDKSPDVFFEIVKSFMKRRDLLLATRLKEEHYTAIKNLREDYEIEERRTARALIIKKRGYEVKRRGGSVGVMTAGSSDIPIAEEARCALEITGIEPITFYDVGVAGLHRIIEPLKKMRLEKVKCIIVVAGMDGALPGVIAGLVRSPVIGVPTSTGYGIGGKGLGALIGMLQSCSPGLAVVNIDAGFNAGAIASLIARGEKC